MPLQRKRCRWRTIFKATWNSAIPMMGFRGDLPGREVGRSLATMEQDWGRVTNRARC